MTQPVIPAETAPHQTDLWKPVLLRAAVALIFGALTVFWPSPSVEVMGAAGGMYLLATGAVLIWGIRKAGFSSEVLPGRILSAGASAMAGSGVAVAALHGDLLFGVIAALGLGLMGAAELYFGIRYRGRHILARDWLASGVIGIGTAVALPFFVSLGAHALLGVAGGGAIISGVLWTLSGLTLRHDARTAPAKAVN
ncbi:hypothetical protein [Pseudarthrobacter sp. N5]|uniref:hypothetical protein n=1 Tax=Pseudarthrobacter sp. N5 TaxID=3418416 RepID=UPI003CF821E9